jgi:hypothetical protein
VPTRTDRLATYRVQVGTASHDDLRAGRIETRMSVVVVLAGSDREAVLVACQIAACTSGAMPTSAELLDFPTD